MAKKKYSFVLEKVCRANKTIEFDLDEFRKEHKEFENESDEDILIHVAETTGMFAWNGFEEEEQNVRSIYDTESLEVVFED